MCDMNKKSNINNNSINFRVGKQNNSPKKQIQKDDTYTKLSADKNTNEAKQMCNAESRFSSGNENLVFKVQKLKFYPDDQKKMDKMSVEDRIAYRRELKKQNRYIILKDDKTEIN